MQNPKVRCLEMQDRIRWRFYQGGQSEKGCAGNTSEKANPWTHFRIAQSTRWGCLPERQACTGRIAADKPISAVS